MTRRILLAAFAIALVGALAGCTQAPVRGSEGTKPVVEPKPVATPKPAASKPEPMPVGGTLPHSMADPRILVLKSQRRLAVYDGDERVKVYAIRLGRRPVGDKVREGDRRTPEGSFYVCVKNAGSRFHKSLGLSYPNSEDAERGLRDGLISQAEYDDVVAAIAARRTPPWDTALGGEIMIHGVDAKRRSGDWTTGCIALTNPEIDELFERIPAGTPVEIRP